MNKGRWQALMNAMGIAPSVDCYHELYAAYSEKHRFYHTVKHIEAMLVHFDAVNELAERPIELELAIWFHDAIYNPLSKNNELNSALWAKEFVCSNGHEASAERVYNLVMATLHNGSIKDNDEKLIVDIDLTILGTSPEVYDEFEKNVRKEYKWVPSFIYRKKRKELLKSLLINPSVYNLEYFQKKYESAARENIARTIEKL